MDNNIKNQDQQRKQPSSLEQDRDRAKQQPQSPSQRSGNTERR